MIELAPGHKQGLPVDNPVLLAGGTIGYGETVPAGLNVATLGGVVVGPFTAASRPGGAPPRMAGTNGGFVLATGGQNRGVKAAMRKFARLWPRLDVPVVAQVVDTDAPSAGRTAGALARSEGILGIELASPSTDLALLREIMRAVTRAADLPLWVKVPMEQAAPVAEAAVGAGAHALVVGQPPNARLPSGRVAADGDIAWVSGSLYGPLVFAMMMMQLCEVVALELGVPLIACGGIHTVEQMQQALAAGASAIQVDSAMWVEPSQPNWLADAWTEQGDARRTS